MRDRSRTDERPEYREPEQRAGSQRAYGSQSATRRYEDPRGGRPGGGGEDERRPVRADQGTDYGHPSQFSYGSGERGRQFERAAYDRVSQGAERAARGAAPGYSGAYDTEGPRRPDWEGAGHFSGAGSGEYRPRERGGDERFEVDPYGAGGYASPGDVTGEYGGAGGGSSYVGPASSSYGGEHHGPVHFGPPEGGSAYTTGYAREHDLGRQQQTSHRSEQPGQRHRNPPPRGWQRSDERIRDDICERLMHEPGIDPRDVSVAVTGGAVLLEGTVPHRRMKHVIEDIADGCSGVNDVDNRLRVASQQTPGSGSWGDTRDASRGGLLGRLFGFQTGAGVRDVMTADVEIVAPDADVRQAAQKMKELDVGAMPVCDGRRLRGMITDRDIAIRIVAAGRDAATSKVADAMTDHVHWCYDDERIDAVLERMGDLQVRRVPVVDRDHQLVGIVSLGDFARRERGAVRDTLQQISQPSSSAHHHTEGSAGRSGV